MSTTWLVRYGAVPEVGRFVLRADVRLERGAAVVVRTHRGLQFGEALEAVSASKTEETDFEIVRSATVDDQSAEARLKSRCEAEFYEWCRRIVLWNLSLELIDLERTLDDEKLILYVLTERGPATTTLALQAAAEGLGIIEVQPVTAAGLVAASAGGCGSGGCGCSH